MQNMADNSDNVTQTIVKAERKPYFSKEEGMFIKVEYNKRRHLLEGKFSSNVTASAKRKAWEEIADSVNSLVCH